jgi:hypothetical protein
MPLSFKYYFTLTPSFNANATLFDHDTSGQENVVRYNYDLSANLASTLYGTFPLKIGSLREIKHTVAPRVSLTWAPAFDDALRFKNVPGVSSGGSESERLNMGFTLDNTFYARVKKDDDLKKIRLFTIQSKRATISNPKTANYRILQAACLLHRFRTLNCLFPPRIRFTGSQRMNRPDST